MKAKEILKQEYEKYYTQDYKGSVLRETYENTTIKAMIEFAKAKCSEQRGICQKIFDLTDAQIGDVFKNAPEPDFK